MKAGLVDQPKFFEYYVADRFKTHLGMLPQFRALEPQKQTSIGYARNGLRQNAGLFNIGEGNCSARKGGACHGHQPEES